MMTRYLRNVVWAGVLATAATACGGDDDPTGPGGSSGSLAAQIDGVAFNASLAVQASRTAQTLTIGGVDGNQRQIQFIVINPTAAGTYQLGPAGGGSTATYSEGTRAWVSSLVGGGGSVTITELTTDGAKGTFTFTAMPGTTTGATGTRNVTGGSFDVVF